MQKGIASSYVAALFGGNHTICPFSCCLFDEEAENELAGEQELMSSLVSACEHMTGALLALSTGRWASCWW